MRWWRWLPWQRFITRIAESRGFIDPIGLMAKLRQFAQPSEVAEPIELVRAGVVMHARGLVNTRAIQHNLDWVWPYWIEKQFNPRDPSFIPRAFSITHINLTHRNWTAAGLPRVDWMPLVDPAGLVTPHYDGWSLDAWVVPDDGSTPLLPSRCADITQRYTFDDGLAVETLAKQDGLSLRSTVRVVMRDDQPTCEITWHADADRAASFVLSLRPVNVEGVSFVHEITLDGKALRVNEESTIQLSRAPQRFRASDYQTGDVYQQLTGETQQTVECNVGMATAAAIYPIQPGESVDLTADVPYVAKLNTPMPNTQWPDATSWDDALRTACQCKLGDERYQMIYDAAIRTLLLHAPGEIYPGPYTYRRFWYRDAVYIMGALLEANLVDHAAAILPRFADGQTAMGYFHSQEGEWDSNGQVLWLLDRYERLTGRPLGDNWLDAMARGARWIARKRTSDDGDQPHAGLLPAGFSAEHLGPNDFYYWDDFWSIAGLEGASRTLRHAGRHDDAERADETAKALRAAVDRSLARSNAHRDRPGIPASPYRRMDAGAIGSIVADYPLRLYEPGYNRLIETVDLLLENCTVKGGFFQDMIHSGINAYLTLHMAQVLLRAGDARCTPLIDAVARLASPTGQWPEAIHPHTEGGCMGDGQHVWAAAEWIMMMRALFVREEGDMLILASGIPASWLEPGKPAVRFGPTPTPWGAITIEVEPRDAHVAVQWQGAWRDAPPPQMAVRLLGGELHAVDPAAGRAEVTRP